MPNLKPSNPEVPQLIPAGLLRHLAVSEVKPSTNNPRHLFDLEELEDLKMNIAEHGVLVPITVYQAKGQSKFSILDGERRYRCVRDLVDEGRVGDDGEPLKLPANVVEPPTKIAHLLYMFSIHNYREAWELMPTALSLKFIMEDLGTEENKALVKLTGLSVTQIERCKKLLKFPERFQGLSLDPNPKTRIPSNFWIEALPVIDLGMETSKHIEELGRDRATDKLVEKYRNKKIRSVIHFRRIMESYDITEDDPPTRAKVLRRLEEFFLKPNLETRDAFDEFVADKKRVRGALSACDVFLAELQRFRLAHTSNDEERKSLRDALKQVQTYCESLENALEGGDDPTVSLED
jgi:ParB family chromosome partitioning protein